MFRKSLGSFVGGLVALGLFFACAGGVQADLVGHWKFDNSLLVGDATVSDDLTAVGNAAYTASGKIGGALNLDGDGDYLNRTDDALPTGLPTGNGSFTIAAWIKTSAVDRYAIVGWGVGAAGQANVFRTNNNAVGEDEGDGLTNYSWGADITRLGTVADSQWHHVAATYDASGSVKTLYLDGVQLGATASMGSDLDVQSSGFRVGYSKPASDEAFNGLIDDLRIYNNALSGGEVAALVPEPGTFVLAIMGLISLLAYAWRRK